MLEWYEILKELRQMFSPEYRWSVDGAIFEGKRLLTMQKDHLIVDMKIDAQIARADLYHAGNILLDKLAKL